MSVIKFLRHFLKKQPQQEVLSPLAIFNRQTKNNIKSTNVSFNSIKGVGIEIKEHTIVDAFSAINDYTYIGLNSTVTKATIGKYCSLGNNVNIGPGEHNLHAVSTSAIFYKYPLDILTKGDCIIGNDVWVGVDSIIKRGVTIGNGAVIGANSVVTKNVPAYAIAVGTPAKVIKYRFERYQIEFLEEFEWWNKDLQWLQENAKDLHDIDKFITKHS